MQATIARLETWSNPRGIKVSRVYEWLRPRAPPYFRTMWHSICEPKHSFMVWLATLERLPAKDRLKLSNGNLSCVLCQSANETHSHMFFHCAVVREVRGEIRRWLHINRQIYTIQSGLK